MKSTLTTSATFSADPKFLTPWIRVVIKVTLTLNLTPNASPNY